MEADQSDGPISFEYLFLLNVPDILEQIFFSLDYCSYKHCLEVCIQWRELLTSKRFIERGRLVFREDIHEDEKELLPCVSRGGGYFDIELLIKHGAKK